MQLHESILTMMQNHVFRKYDIRGTVSKDFDIQDIYGVTQAIVVYFKQINKEIKTIAVGMDGRLHSPQIKTQVCNALIDSGLDVIFIGLCPTPALYFATHVMAVDAGIMITASHNPKEDNGLKLILNKESVWDSQIQCIRELYKTKSYIHSQAKGNYFEQSIISSYVDMLAESFENLKNDELSCVINCGNGAAGSVLPELIKRMGWKNVQLLYPEIDGNYPNHEPDPSCPESITAMQNCLNKNAEMQLAMGLDGDCDRLSVMTKPGFFLPGDQLLAILSLSLENIKTNTSFNKVVCDVKCSQGLAELLEQMGIKTIISATGIAYIKNAMKEHNAMLGGELSGHFCFKDCYFGYDDGIYAIMRLLEILKKTGKTLQELSSRFPIKVSSPEFRIPCREEQKKEIINQTIIILSSRKDVVINNTDGIRAQMKYGWGILRESNTQPMLSLRFEGNNTNDLARVKQDFFEAISPFFENDWLRKQLDF